MKGEDSMHSVSDIGAMGDIRGGGARADSDSVTERLLTYDERWEGQIAKEELARAGFRYTGIGDKVECDQCGLKLLNWTSKDNPLHEHATRRPLCPFINSRYRQLGQTKPPKHPKYQQLQERLDSFVAWPGRYVPKTPEELAAAGFFYIGSADRVTCFQCGITLRDWEEEHDPVTEHQRYSENCEFINKPDIKQLGVATRTFDKTETNQSGQEPTTNEVHESAGACGGETPVNGHTLEKSNMVTCRTRTTADEVDNTNGDVRDFGKAEGACSETTASNFDQNQDNNIMPSCQNTVTMACQAGGEKEGTLDTRSGPQAVETSMATKMTATSPATKSVAETTTSGRSKKPTNRAVRLAEENRSLKEKGMCKLCREKGVAILFLPCGHLVTCSDCAPNVSNCVVCGKTILGTVKTFLT